MPFLTKRSSYLAILTRFEATFPNSGTVRAESGELVNYEAQATDCIAIGSDIDGIPEYIIDAETGLLFKNEDTSDLSRRIITVAENDIPIQKIREVALKNSKKHGWNIFINSYIDFYTNISRNYRPKESKP